MSQTDLNVANASGAVVRADLNDHFQALATNSSGATAPTTTFPHQWWFDESTNDLNQRNAGNMAWILVARKNESGWTPYLQGTLLEKATQPETDAGTNDGKFITPLKLATFPGIEVNALSQGMVADGTDSRAAFVTALAASGGKTLHLPKGVFRLNLTTASTQVVPLADTVIEGVGDGSVLEVFVTGAGGVRVLFDLNNSNLTLRNLKIIVTAPVGQSWTFKLFEPGNAASELILDNVTIDGFVTNNAGAQSHIVWIVSWVDTENWDGLTFDRCRFSRCSRSIVKTNAATSTQNRLKILNGTHMRDFFAPFITMNTTNGTISDVLIDDATFEDNRAAEVGGNAHHIQGGSADNFRVLSSHFKGTGSEAVHIEEKATHVTLSFNTVENDGDGFTFVDNNIGAQATPSWIMVIGNIMRSQTVGSNRAVRFLNVGNGFPPVNHINVADNIFRDYEFGVHSTVSDDDISITDNTFQNVTKAIRLNKPSTKVRNNIIIDGTIGLGSDTGGMWGHHDFDNVTIPLAVVSGGSSILSYNIIVTTNLPASTITNVNFIPIGNQFFGLLAVHWVHSLTIHREVVRELTWDATTLTDTPKVSRGSGDVSFVAIVNNAGNLAVRLGNTAVSARNGGRLQVGLITGMHTA